MFWPPCFATKSTSCPTVMLLVKKKITQACHYSLFAISSSVSSMSRICSGNRLKACCIWSLTSHLDSTAPSLVPATIAHTAIATTIPAHWIVDISVALLISFCDLQPDIFFRKIKQLVALYTQLPPPGLRPHLDIRTGQVYECTCRLALRWAHW